VSKSYKRIEAVSKTIAILKYLGNCKEPVSGVEIGKALGIAEGTVMCHLATLEDGGFVVSVGDRWMLGTALALIWARVKSSLEADKDRIEKDLRDIQI